MLRVSAGQSYPANAVSLTDVDMLLVPSAAFRRLVDEHEAMWDFVFGSSAAGFPA
jgi:CRP-like cAMP-binding protein